MDNRLKRDLEKTYNLIESWLDLKEIREKISKFSNLIII
jgi:hypothetical protein